MKTLKQLMTTCHSKRCKENPNIQPSYIPVRKYEDKTANGLTKAIIRWFELLGMQAERVNNMGIYKKGLSYIDVLGQKIEKKGKYIKGGGTNGTADIHATAFGRSIKIEVKIGNDRQSEAQKLYQSKIEQSGGIYIIARSFEQTITELETKCDQLQAEIKKFSDIDNF